MGYRFETVPRVTFCRFPSLKGPHPFGLMPAPSAVTGHATTSPGSFEASITTISVKVVMALSSAIGLFPWDCRRPCRGFTGECARRIGADDIEGHLGLVRVYRDLEHTVIATMLSASLPSKSRPERAIPDPAENLILFSHLAIQGACSNLPR
jgi:hypothetical protein